MTLQSVYEEGVALLEKAGVAEASLDARILLEHVTGCTRNDLLVHGDREIAGDQYAEYLKLVNERATRIPLQYLTGQQNFMGLDFKVSRDTLIPRQDTEILTEEVLRYFHDGMRILDLCTGTGCILISLLHYSNDCSGVGTDLAPGAVKTARENADKLLGENADRAEFLLGDLFEGVDGKFEIVVSNPPYIPTEIIGSLEPEVRDHEPMAALDGEADGLAFYRRIIPGALDYLAGGGMLFLEIGYDQGPDVKALMEEAGYLEVSVVQDYAGLDRVVLGTRPTTGLA
jgi:release factor glutamine methyltransferase